MDLLALDEAAGRPVDVRQPGEGRAEDGGLGLLEQAGATAWLDGDARDLQRVEDLARRRRARARGSRCRGSARPARGAPRCRARSRRPRPARRRGRRRSRPPARPPAGSGPSPCRVAPGSTARTRWRAATMPGRDRRLTRRLNCVDVVVAVCEGDDVVDVGAAPLVDRLVVVADDDHVGSAVGLRRAARMSCSCAGLTSWYSSTIRCRRSAVTAARIVRVFQRADRLDDLRAERHEAVAVEHRVVRSADSLKSPSGRSSTRDAARSRRRRCSPGTP